MAREGSPFRIVSSISAALFASLACSSCSDKELAVIPPTGSTFPSASCCKRAAFSFGVSVHSLESCPDAEEIPCLLWTRVFCENPLDLSFRGSARRALMSFCSGNCTIQSGLAFSCFTFSASTSCNRKDTDFSERLAVISRGLHVPLLPSACAPLVRERPRQHHPVL